MKLHEDSGLATKVNFRIMTHAIGGTASSKNNMVASLFFFFFLIMYLDFCNFVVNITGLSKSLSETDYNLVCPTQKKIVRVDINLS